MIPNPRDMTNYEVTGRLVNSLPLPGHATPEVYLQFARSDLRRPYKRNRVNALSNAKRALHLQIDVVADALGLKALPRKKRQHFPQKLDFLSRCGVLVPSIVGRLNRLRNMVEHEYYIPEPGEAADFLDVVELFLAASRAMRTSFPHQMHFGWAHRTRTPDTLPVSFGVQVRPGTGTIWFALPERGTKDRRASLRIMVPAKGRDADVAWTSVKSTSVADGKPYFDWISLIVSRNTA